MASQPNPVPRLWRRYLRFSVRGLIVLVLVIGVALGWIVRLIRSARIQREAVAAIKRVGGGVFYDPVYIEGRRMPAEPWAPQWFTNLIGVDYFGSVTEVTFCKRANDEKIALISRLSCVERLDAVGTEITNAGMPHLTVLTNLTWLDLDGTQVSDAGLAHLKTLKKLLHVNVRYTNVSEAGIKGLRQALPGLTVTH